MLRGDFGALVERVARRALRCLYTSDLCAFSFLIFFSFLFFNSFFQLALKHRINKTQRQRILLFVGSPVVASEKQLVQLGRQLKKNNIALDIVCLANVEENRAKLTAMHAAVNSNDTSRFVEYPAGSSSLLSDVMVSAMLLHDPEAAAAAAAAGGDSAVNEFGVDPNVDPDLYMVLRMSLEEARQQQQQQQGAAAGAAAATAPAGQPAAAAGSAELPPGAAQIEGLEDMDEELRQAVLLSLQDYCGDASSTEATQQQQQQQQQEQQQGEGQESQGAANGAGAAAAAETEAAAAAAPNNANEQPPGDAAEKEPKGSS
ncbi:26S proteasome non-ATPase regulatory subunit 4, putative [Eimeria tenella]|uniref:26S proteasome non-ATPase regulatory subunit 4, putative n=1 Tax=Eimeria tenella TaxID=5802 RepID=U6KWR3_EIMTE|nr:26S proteasome non-ATPase regulatory subunit 4, putative [Eimeria tenella]CDJ39920.1 26S proteasome non-ATPase regulatory subunit 4, putative [Eimeria tenella]|eukprot:XP_013230673.1 26S proteasome non-ATPase regulatory subunit 4, putative [Eimeria tenella]